jgi:hypothetical protein
MLTSRQAEPAFRERWQWRYGFLSLLVALLIWNLQGLPETLRSAVPAPFGMLFLVLGMILGHLVGSFIPPGRLANVLWVLYFAWIAFVFAYLYTAGFSRVPSW